MGANERRLQNEAFQKTFLSGILKREFACREILLTAGCQRHIPTRVVCGRELNSTDRVGISGDSGECDVS